MVLRLFEGDKQYNSKVDLCESIKTTMSKIEPVEVKVSTELMDKRLLAVIEKKSHYIKM